MSQNIRLLRRSVIVLLSIFLLLGLPHIVEAQEEYVNSPSQFSTALSTASSNGQADTITLAPGTFLLTETFTFTPANTEDFPLTIQGDAALSTTLDGGGVRQILTIDTTGMTSDANVTITIRDLAFTNGNVVGNGGALKVTLNDGSLYMENNLFIANSATLAGGGMYASTGSGSVYISGNSFDGNSSGTVYSDFDIVAGGGAYVQGAQVTLSNNVFENNNIEFIGSLSDLSGAGVCILASGPMIDALNMTGNLFSGNNLSPFGVGGGGGAYVEIIGYSGSSDPSGYLADNVFKNNTYGAGLRLSIENGILEVLNNRFLDHAQYGGVNINLHDTAAIYFAGNIVDGNTEGGVSIYNPAGVPEIINNTIINNDNYYGGGLYLHGFTDYVDTAVIANNIIRGNSSAGAGSDIYVNMYDIDNTPSLAFTVYLSNNDYSALDGACFNSCTPIFVETGNIDADPLLIAPSLGDYHLSVNSPCIDTGTNDVTLPLTDFECQGRIYNWTVDMGVDEFSTDATCCTGEPEVCDGLDNDCDGLVDEDFTNLGDPCSAGVGECQADGIYQCNAGGTDTECSAVAGSPEAEICDGLDNDCDGSVDEDFTNLGDLCSAGVGECQADGVYQCNVTGDDTECSATPGSPTTEICGDGLDQDCNGEDLPCDTSDDDGDGYSESDGDCDDTNSAIHPGATEVCNGTDDDCDSATADGADETWLGDACDGADSDLCQEGTYSCVDGSQSCSDTSSDDLDVCNGSDDDCDPASADGSEDPLLGLSCDGSDSDLCEEGTNSCTGGAIVCSDTTGDNSEICNGTDDDCNPATADGADETWLGDACDGADSDLCQEGTYSCVDGSQSCSDTTGDIPEVCNGTDDDCNPATLDGVNEPWFGNSCDGADSDLCLEGTYSCVDGSQSCSDTSSDDLDLCNGSDDDCNPLTIDGADETWLGAACDGVDSDECEEGTFDCSAGTQVCSDSTTDDAEICGNLIDDDCDGNRDCADLDDCSSSHFCGDVRIEPDFIDIGVVTVGSSKSVMFSLVNIGAVDQWVWAPNLYSVAPSGAPDTIWMLTTGAGDTCPDPPFWLSPGTSCNLVVIFYPKDELLYQGSLRAFYNTEESPFSGNLAWAEVFGEGEADIPIINRADSGCGCSLSNSDGKVTLRPIALLALFVYGLCLWRRRRKT